MNANWMAVHSDFKYGYCLCTNYEQNNYKYKNRASGGTKTSVMLSQSVKNDPKKATSSHMTLA